MCLLSNFFLSISFPASLLTAHISPFSIPLSSFALSPSSPFSGYRCLSTPHFPLSLSIFVSLFLPPFLVLPLSRSRKQHSLLVISSIPSPVLLFLQSILSLSNSLLLHRRPLSHSLFLSLALRLSFSLAISLPFLVNIFLSFSHFLPSHLPISLYPSHALVDRLSLSLSLSLLLAIFISFPLPFFYSKILFLSSFDLALS